MGKQIPKRDRLGAYLKIEGIYLETLELCISAAFETKNNKLPYLKSARSKIEIQKRLIRTFNELGIIENKKYLLLENYLQEISKMINGWIGYLSK